MSAYHPASAGSVRLKPGREKSLQRRHPWLFAGAIASVDGRKGDDDGGDVPAAGASVDIFGARGAWLARGAWSPQSQLRVRIWTFERDETVDAAFFERRLRQAVALRAGLPPALLNPRACRLVNGESDGLPGLSVDRYDDFLVCQFSSAGADSWRETLVAALIEITGCANVYERSDLEVRQKEGLPARSGVLAGVEPPPLIEIEEHGARFLVDIRHGHKTGFYLDQRDNRAVARLYCARGEVLNAFCYTGGFTVAALLAGADRVVQIDSSADALALARRQLALNGLDEAAVESIEGNVFGVLRGFREQQRRFDGIVLDPPKFVETRAQLERACRGYKDINWLAFRLLKPGGVLLTFSCSGLLEPALFQKIVADAALDAGVDACILARLGQATDHPTRLSFPEGRYLQGLICRV